MPLKNANRPIFQRGWSTSALEYDVVKYTVRVALRLSVDDSTVGVRDAARVLRFLRENPDYLVKVKKGMLYCGVCGKGPFTKRGLYLHLTRVHAEEIARALRQAPESPRKL
jgi:hypothetical protein